MDVLMKVFVVFSVWSVMVLAVFLAQYTRHRMEMAKRERTNEERICKLHLVDSKKEVK